MMLDKFLQYIVPPEPTDSSVPVVPWAPDVEGNFFGIGSRISEMSVNGGIFSWAGLLAFLGLLWSIYTLLAYIAAIIFLVLYVYASIRKNYYFDLQTQTLRDSEKLYDELYRGETSRNNRIQDVLSHSISDSPNDWKLAIIEADIILDDILKERGYAGNSLGERLKSISLNQLASLNDAWEAHKIRNRIAHDGADFVLTKRVAQETIARYQRVFAEFGVT